MKASGLLLVICMLASGCGRTGTETLCGCENLNPFPVERQVATLEGNTLEFDLLVMMAFGSNMQEITANVCNPELLDSLQFPETTSKVVFTGEYFKNCHDDGLLIHIHDIVSAPRGLNER